MQDMRNIERELMTTCIKCGKGGNVLVCNGCPITVHKSCMACSPGFDSAGNFNCPYCLYKQSVEELNIIREKVLMARRAVSMFSDGTSGGNNGCNEPQGQRVKKRRMQQQEEGGGQVMKKKKQKVGVTRPVRMENNECNLGDVSGKLLDEEPVASLVTEKARTALTESFQENSGIREVDNSKPSDSENRVNMCSEVGDRPHTVTEVVGTSQKCASLGIVSGKKIISENCLQKDGLGNMSAAGEKQQLDAVGNAEPEEETGGEEEAPLTFDPLWKNQEIKQVREERRDPEETVSTRHGEDSRSEIVGKGDGDAINKKPRRGGRVGRSPGNGWREILHEHAKSHIEGRVKSTDFKQSVGNSKEEPSGMKQFEFEDSLVASDSNMAVATQRRTAASSNGKRKKLEWTSEEVEMLKQAVVMFSSNPRKNLPWRKMLDYGRDVFDGTRTPSDLKDKWKLILKREAIRRAAMADLPKRKDAMDEESTSW